jgi:hypothetical protein
LNTSEEESRAPAFCGQPFALQTVSFQAVKSHFSRRGPGMSMFAPSRVPLRILLHKAPSVQAKTRNTQHIQNSGQFFASCRKYNSEPPYREDKNPAPPYMVPLISSCYFLFSVSYLNNSEIEPVAQGIEKIKKNARSRVF